ncbi:dihydroneopterin aldolase [Lactobacillus sp. CC-MHH1034]|uniref:dihydroneopterin aldolase n=1 Tax=Agrilactobacillus fermenti TaxID=2586909 RepID=UPI001E5A52E1|nr:dihydroneopterin aldolase [Agrilactobacillus fermenti]MCD2256068.1 dihydroneopterin aldolase [Agrilactobacillus fermenti]
MLSVRLNNMKFHGHIGVYPEEKKIGQDLEIDVALQTKVDVQQIHDDLTQTISYGAVYRQIQKIVSTSRVDLVETLATDIMNAIKATYAEQVTHVTVRIRKLNTPIDGIMDNV